MRQASYAHIALGTQDLDGVFEQLEARGAEVIQEPIQHPLGVRDCAFLGPAGDIARIWECAVPADLKVRQVPGSMSRATSPKYGLLQYLGTACRQAFRAFQTVISPLTRAGFCISLIDCMIQRDGGRYVPKIGIVLPPRSDSCGIAVPRLPLAGLLVTDRVRCRSRLARGGPMWCWRPLRRRQALFPSAGEERGGGQAGCDGGCGGGEQGALGTELCGQRAAEGSAERGGEHGERADNVPGGAVLEQVEGTVPPVPARSSRASSLWAGRRPG